MNRSLQTSLTATRNPLSIPHRHPMWIHHDSWWKWQTTQAQGKRLILILPLLKTSCYLPLDKQDQWLQSPLSPTSYQWSLQHTWRTDWDHDGKLQSMLWWSPRSLGCSWKVDLVPVLTSAPSMEATTYCFLPLAISRSAFFSKNKPTLVSFTGLELA